MDKNFMREVEGNEIRRIKRRKDNKWQEGKMKGNGRQKRGNRVSKRHVSYTVDKNGYEGNSIIH